MLTYNQEDFIAQAIEGVLMQQTNFNYQLVIGEDCSTDKTREICKQYASKYPSKIKLLLADKNMGLIGNYIKTYSECTGKYVAICDGDDYWIDPFKLQNQVDFLEKNPEFDLIFTSHKDLFPSGEIKIRNTNKLLDTSSFKELVFENYIASVTVLFKNEQLPETMESWMMNLPYGDWPTYLWILKDGGKVKFLNEATAVYRKNLGISTNLREYRDKIGRINLYILRNILKEPFFLKKKAIIEKAISRLELGLMASYNREGKYVKAFILFIKLCAKKNPVYIAKLFAYSLRRNFLPESKKLKMLL